MAVYTKYPSKSPRAASRDVDFIPRIVQQRIVLGCSLAPRLQRRFPNSAVPNSIRIAQPPEFDFGCPDCALFRGVTGGGHWNVCVYAHTHMSAFAQKWAHSSVKCGRTGVPLFKKV